MQRDAPTALAALAVNRQGRTPGAEFGCPLQHFQMPGMTLQQASPKRHRILPRESGHFVHEAFLEEGLMRMADRAPEADRNRLNCRLVRDARRRKLIGLVKGPFTGGLVRTNCRQIEDAAQHRRHDRLARRQVSPDGQTTLRIEARLKAGERRRPVEVMRHVLLTRPERLHRCAIGGHGDCCGLADKVDIEPATESTAEILDLNIDLVGIQSGGLGHRAPGQIGCLGRDPGGRTAIADLHRAIHRLKRCMRQIGCPILGRQLFRRDRHRAIGITD